MWGEQVKEEGWYLVLGDPTTQELHALKRVSLAHRATARLTFPAGSGGSHLHLLLLSDSYMGLDQCLHVSLEPGSHENGTGAGSRGGSSQANGQGQGLVNPRQPGKVRLGG